MECISLDTLHFAFRISKMTLQGVLISIRSFCIYAGLSPAAFISVVVRNMGSDPLAHF